MVKFRRSVKSDKDFKPAHISVPAKDAIAIVPPKKVIKALYDYQAPGNNPNGGYLSFSQGDFLHVVGREDDEDWYEACNPLQGHRGLVPAKYFDTVGKTVRDSAGSSNSNPSPAALSNGHDSGYADAMVSPGMNGNNGASEGPKMMRMSKALAKGTGAMVYGVVMYDFKAERPDELDAKEGEAIIVIAQSNPEWFVAKPITRLGGPGLIPVSFIEIRDMTTGQAVPDAQEAVSRAGVPKVEEWKKMAADYKNGSIPLGKLDGTASMQQSMERMSLSGQGQPGFNAYGTSNQQYQSNGAYQSQDPYANSQQGGKKMLAPVKASVPRYCFADDIFWFIVEAQMEDGSHWELSRLYQDFYDLQISLIQEFPHEAGNVEGYQRSLPYMPGPVTYVTDNISNGRRANLDEYIRNLLKLGPHLTQGHLVRGFFAPRPGDNEIDPNVPDSYRLSQASQQSRSDPSAPLSQQSSAGNLNYPMPSNYPSHQRSQGSISSSQQGHYRTGSELGVPPMNRANSAMTQASGTSAGSQPAPGAAVKIKVWFEQDNCVVIRMPPQFSFNELYERLKERRSLGHYDGAGDAELTVKYRDERSSELRDVRNDSDLDRAMQSSASKLTLEVSVSR
ncbi:hypothetical protein K402DRAFT_424389 [Aulographum hederae CBS 113979]|uniref:Uncharacterized protein n=1 Tax=Aulographum hederae CBS 113979 TaxID=1176131 RepID=A0A6G1GPF3_9PEZI|nr:hypothetical protein K402DRAFT_424389 [Aulographum hederae CBS 113979]